MYLSNSDSPCQEWIIADINHDNTEGTVDLFPKYILDKTAMSYCSTTITGTDVICYKRSNVRSYLVGKIYNGFNDEIKNAIIPQHFSIRYYSNIEYLDDNVRCPSYTDIGIIYNETRDGITYTAYDEEGTIYPIFGGAAKKQNPLACYRDINGTIQTYWVRSRCNRDYNGCIVRSSGTYEVNPIYTAGGTQNCDYYNGHHVVGIIRFGKK